MADHGPCQDARILGDIKAMRAAYAQLYTLNAELMAEYAKRANNHEQARAPGSKPSPPYPHPDRSADRAAGRRAVTAEGTGSILVRALIDC